MNIAAIPLCSNCKYYHISSNSEPCINCKDYSKWDPGPVFEYADKLKDLRDYVENMIRKFEDGYCDAEEIIEDLAYEINAIKQWEDDNRIEED